MRNADVSLWEVQAAKQCWSGCRDKERFLYSRFFYGGQSTLSCYDVAQYFLAKADEDAGDLMSNLKLQKLVYYAQGFALVLLEKPLFPERIEAWIHGPVVPHAISTAGDRALLHANSGKKLPCRGDLLYSLAGPGFHAIMTMGE